MNKIIFFTILLLLSIKLSYAAIFQNYKTEIVKIADGIILEKKINSSTGKIISEEYKIKVNGNYYSAELKDGKYQISQKGKDDIEEASKNENSSGGGGGCWSIIISIYKL